ncbi:ATP-binding cassette domain-containing protein [Lederbergia panacisoli]|uniref:ATP-binding cassette domain-containing protein n=1 Tax=Lederbergia panacisoli TaxID=1255251 RepID=UPI00214B3F2D|nr:ATP-binding cassette domain-containing protein [Lederbergia panacisoli]MCR2823545.1 ATP-binding cassette domain-containing protein [Lederbergia panacisoli]
MRVKQGNKSSVFKKVKHLSGGERIRLKLAILLFQDINLLILDEPTNHLDIDSIETLEEALDDFKGTIFFISHDRYFINKIGERVVVVEDHSLKSYLGNYDYYKSKKEKVILQERKEPVIKSEKVKTERYSSEDSKKEAAKAKALARIENLENEINEIDMAMAENHNNYEKLNKLYGRKIELNKELDLVMEVWLSLENN